MYLALLLMYFISAAVILLVSLTLIVQASLPYDNTGKDSVLYNFILFILRILCGLNTLFNPLNAELNPICCLLELLGAHHFLHVSRIRVKSLTLRLLISYIYIQGVPGGMCQTSGGCSLC